MATILTILLRINWPNLVLEMREIAVTRNFQGYFLRTFQDLKHQFPGLSRTKVIFQDFPGPGNLKKKSRTFQEAWEPWLEHQRRFITTRALHPRMAIFKPVWPFNHMMLRKFSDDNSNGSEVIAVTKKQTHKQTILKTIPPHCTSVNNKSWDWAGFNVYTNTL